MIDDLRRFVEETRGVRFERPVEVEMVDDEEFERRLLADLESERDAIDAVEPRFRALGIIGADDVLYDELRTLIGASGVGFYDPRTEELVVRGPELSVYAREVVVHELAHALDDQLTDLEDEDFAPWAADEGLALLSAIEGSAEWVRTQYVRGLSDGQRDASTREQLRLAGQQLRALVGLPAGLIDLVTVPYRQGLRFATAVVEGGGPDELIAVVDAMPPASMEHVLHPADYPDDKPLAVPAPAADGAVVEEGVLGELYLSRFLRDEGEAAEGWGGDRFVVWEEQTRACIRVSVAGDSPDDLRELVEAGARWAQDGIGRDVVIGETAVTLTRCA